MTRIQRVWRVFSLQGDEYRFAVPLFLLYFLSGSFYAIGQIYTETMFLKAYGAEGLSRFFMYNGLMIIAAGVLYNLLLLKISLQKGYLLLIAIFSLLIMSVSYMGFLNNARLPFYLYCANYLFTFFLDMHFFNYIFQFLTLRNAKRILPFLMGGGKLGGICVCILIFSILSGKLPEYGMLIWAANGALLLLPFLLLGGRVRRYSVQQPDRSYELIPDTRLLEKILRKVRISATSPIFAWSVLLVFVTSVANQISEFYFARIFNSAFTTHESLASFLSLFTFGADLITLLLQLFLMSRIITALGVKRANYIYPGSFFAFTALLALNAGIIAGILLRFFRKNLSLLFRTPVFNIILAAAPRDRMSEMKSFMNGIISPLGMVAGGGMVLVISERTGAAQGLAIAAALGALYLGLTAFQNSSYIGSLKKLLVFGTQPGNEVPEISSYMELTSNSNVIRDNLPLLETLYENEPSLHLTNALLPFYGELLPSTRENMLAFISTTRFEKERDILAAALGDNEPAIRARALHLLTSWPLAARTDIIERHFTPGLASEHDACEILTGGISDLDLFAMKKILETADGAAAGRTDPIEFVVLAQALPHPYYLDTALRLARNTKDMHVMRLITGVSDKLTRGQLRRLIFWYRRQPIDLSVNLLSLAESALELDRAVILDARSEISRDAMSRIFRYDEKLTRLVLSRLMRQKSFDQKYNYLNYLLCLGIRPLQKMRSFIDYEADKIASLRRLQSSLEHGNHPGKDSGQYRFVCMAMEETIEMHKQLMLKALAVYTGTDIEEIYDSSVFINDYDLNNYLMEFIETSGGPGRRALAALEHSPSQGDDQHRGKIYDTQEIINAFTAGSRHFLPLTWPCLDLCAARLDGERDITEGIGASYISEEEHAMLSLVEKMVFLKENTLFSGLRLQELYHIARVTRELEFPRGKSVISEGDSGDELYIVVEGEVEVHTHEKHLDRIGPGNCIGELAIIDSEPRSASATTITASRILSLNRSDFLLTLKENPAISISIMRVMAKRLRRLIAS